MKTLSPLQSRFLRMGAVFVAVVVSLLALSNDQHWLLLPVLAVLATISVLPERNPILYWPVGLLMVLVGSYMFYWAQWFGNQSGVTANSAQTMFLVLIVAFAALATLRVLLYSGTLSISFSPGYWLSFLLMTTVPVVLISLVTSRWFDEPVRLISGHLAGGDHGAHNEIVHRLLAASNDVVYASPVQMYTYPQSLHFLIANLVALTGSVSELPLLAQEYAMGAWFEWLQFAAFAQISIVVFMKNVTVNPLRRAIYLGPLVFVFAAMDNFVSHLLWSGFTTSLGMTWLLLTFVAISDRITFTGTQQSIFSFVVLTVFAYASWIVYQPYAVIFVAMAGFLLLRMSMQRLRDRPFVAVMQQVVVHPVAIVVAVAVSLVVALLGVLGRNSPAVTSLLLDGATYKPYFYTVLLWAVIAIAGVWLLERRGTSGLSTTLHFLLVHLGFVMGMVVTVMIAGGFGILSQPYYTQKMFWILLFVSFPVGLSVLFTYLEGLQSEWPLSKKFGLGVVVALSLLFTPLVQGRYPVAATRKHNVDWFAQAMVQKDGYGDTENRAVAFSWTDRLGSHLSNLALRSTSDIVMPVETGTSGNTYLACRFINDSRASLVYTTPNGRAELVEAGCPDDVLYVENGQLMENPQLTLADLPLNNRRKIAANEIGFLYLIRGFLPPEKWGTWAGGYQSLLGFRSPANLASGTVTLELEANRARRASQIVYVRVNGDVTKTVSMPRRGGMSVPVSLVGLRKGQDVRIALECKRTDDEVLKDDPVDGPIPCVGVKSIELRRGS